jgi:hypothetical protein
LLEGQSAAVFIGDLAPSVVEHCQLGSSSIG